MQAEIGVMRPEAKERLGFPGSHQQLQEPRKDPALVSEGSGAMRHPDLGPLALALRIHPLLGTLLQLSCKLTCFSFSSNSHQIPELSQTIHALSTLSTFLKEEVPARSLPSHGHSPSKDSVLPGPCLLYLHLLVQTCSHSHPPDEDSALHPHFSGPYHNKLLKKSSTPSLHSLTTHSPTPTWLLSSPPLMRFTTIQLVSHLNLSLEDDQLYTCICYLALQTSKKQSTDV